MRQRSRRAPTKPPITPPAIGPALLLPLLVSLAPACVLCHEKREGGGVEDKQFEIIRMHDVVTYYSCSMHEELLRQDLSYHEDMQRPYSLNPAVSFIS